MKIRRTYTETNNCGEHKVLEQQNGIKIKLLRKPTPEYLEKLRERARQEEERRQEEKIQEAREKLIKQRMREIAIKELEDEGLL